MGGSRAVAPMVGSLPGSCMLAVGVNRKNGKMGEKVVGKLHGNPFTFVFGFEKATLSFLWLEVLFFCSLKVL